MGDISEVSILSAHAANHKQGGSDPIRLDELATPLDNTVLNSTNARHGLLPKLSNDALQFLNGAGSFVAISSNALPVHATRHAEGGADELKLDDCGIPDDNTDLNSSTARHGLLSKLPGNTTQFMRGDGNWADPDNNVSTTSVYDSFTTPFTWSNTDAGTGFAGTNLLSSNGLLRLVYRGVNDDNPADRGTGGVRVPSVLPPDGSPRVYWVKPYSGDNSLSDASLTLTESVFTDFDVTFYMRTVNQLKSVPNEWETVWFMWHFNPNGFNLSQHGAHFHHYYVMLKTSGHIEIGRKDQLQDAFGEPTSVDPDFQYFLGSASGSYGTEPTFTYIEGHWYKIRVVMHGYDIQVYVDDVLKASFTDDGSWGTPSTDTNDGAPPHPPTAAMANGKFGFYSEDAEVEWSPLTITTGSQTSNSIDPGVANIFTAPQTFSAPTQETIALWRALNTVGAQVGMAFDLHNSTNGRVSYAFIEGQIYDNTGGAQSGGLNFYSVLSGASKRVLRLSQSGMVTVNKIAESATAEVLLTMGVDDDVTSSFSIANAFNNTGVFVPILTLSATGASVTSAMAAGYYYHEITAANDSGSTPVVIFNAYRNTPAAISVRPCYDFRNNATSIFRINNDGSLKFSTSGSISAILALSGITGNRTYTFPDQTTLLAGQDFINLFTVAQFLANNIPLRTKDSTATNRDMLKWDATDHLILGTSAGIVNTYIYAGASTAALNIDNTNHLLFTKMSQTTTAEELIKFMISDDATSYISLGNAFNTNSIFVPIWTSSVTGSGITSSHAASYWYNEIKSGVDSGAVPVVIWNAYLDTPAAVATRPLYDFRNNGTMVFRIKPGGIEIQDAKDITISSGTGSKIGQSNSKIGFFGTTPVAQAAANADTSGATLGQLETEVNELKAMLRAYGLIQ